MKKSCLFMLTALCGFAVSAAPEVVKTTDFGFNEKDATACVQKAFDSGAKKVIIVNVGKDYIVRPLTMRSNQEVVLEKGVKLRAKVEDYIDIASRIINYDFVENSVLRGEGDNVIEMDKSVVTAPPYQTSEWRHAVCLRDSHHITISNLTFAGSGGDGIYISGPHASFKRVLKGYASDITLEKLNVIGHHRQGLSVISVSGLVVRDCKFSGTKGTAPQAGIDIEPNVASDRVENIVIENCEMNDNSGAGFVHYLVPLDQTSRPVSITVKNCVMKGNAFGFTSRDCGGMLSQYLNTRGGEKVVAPRSPSGKIVLENCEISNSRCNEILIVEKSPDIRLELRDLTITTGKSKSPAVGFVMRNLQNFDNFWVVNCRINAVNDEQLFFNPQPGYGIGENVRGKFSVFSRERSFLGDIDLVALRAEKFTPNPELQEITKVRRLNSLDIVPMQPGVTLPADKKLPQLDSSVLFSYFAPRAGEYPMTVNAELYGGVVRNIHFKTWDGDGKEIDRGELPYDSENKYVIKSKKPGMYSVLLETVLEKLTVASPNPACGIDASTPAIFRDNDEFQVYFTVPKGARNVVVVVDTDSNATVSAELIDSQNNSVAAVNSATSAQVLHYRRQADQSEEVWSVKARVNGSRVHIRLAGETIPLLVASPEAAPTLRK